MKITIELTQNQLEELRKIVGNELVNAGDDRYRYNTFGNGYPYDYELRYQTIEQLSDIVGASRAPLFSQE